MSEKTKIGIPRALIYWKRPYFWESFFENLGFEVLLSPKTNKEIIELGVKMADPETCFSNKVFWGHLLWLDGLQPTHHPPAEAGPECDLIFVPRLKTNKDKLEYCPKFFGLPDLAKILVKTPILTETFDERKEKFEKTIKRLGKKLGKSIQEVKKATEMASIEEMEVREKEEQDFLKKIHSIKQKIILISHPYNLYDDYVNLGMKEKLEKLGAEAIFLDEVPSQKFEFHPEPERSSLRGSPVQSSTFVPGQNPSYSQFHWEFGREIMAKIQEILKYDIAGVIELSSFQCGCDAVLKEFVEKEFKIKKIPFLYLLIDEHTGEAGFQTRLEAFMDTLT